jgi:hypothetical protein
MLATEADAGDVELDDDVDDDDSDGDVGIDFWCPDAAAADEAVSRNEESHSGDG